MECVDNETLNQYIDGELDTAMQAMVEAQIQNCTYCTERLQKLQQQDQLLMQALGRQGTSQRQRCDCGKPEQLCAYVHKQLSPPEVAEVEQRLQTCAVCLGEVMGMRKMLRLQQQEALLQPPAHLVAQVKQEIAPSPSLGTLVIQVAQAGLKFLESLRLPDHVQFDLSS